LTSLLFLCRLGLSPLKINNILRYYIMSYENTWNYNGKVFNSVNIHDYFSFVYNITGKS